MESQHLKNVIEAALLAAGGPLTLDQLKTLFGDNDGPEKADLKAALTQLEEEYSTRGIEIVEVASGYRVQVRDGMASWLAKLWEERPPRYSRALMETLAIIAYRQPVTRGDVEDIRGVQVTSNIIRTLLERDWIKVVGHRDVPGKPAMFGTTRGFLDYFGLKQLDDLPPLAELADLEPVGVQLELGTADQLPEELLEDKSDEASDEPEDSADGDADEYAESDSDDDDFDADESAESDDDLDVDDSTESEVTEGDSDAEDSDDDSNDSSNVSSLDRARAAAHREPETDFNAERAEVVPLKKS